MSDKERIKELEEQIEHLRQAIKDADYITAMSPHVTLRLGRIIKVAKASLMNIITVGDVPVAEYARRVLNEIAKIENE